MQQIIDWISNHLWTVIIAVPTLIQITPIKIDPWSALLKWIGKVITGDACKKMDDMKKEIDKIDDLVTSVETLSQDVNKINQEVMTNEKDRIRWEILDFANSCRNHRKHTRDEFQHIIALNDKYKDLLEKTNDKNGVFEIEYNYIQKLYAKRLEKNDFLEEGEIDD